MDEHWEQLDDGRSLQEIRASNPDAAAGTTMFNNKHIWLGDVSLGELSDWVRDVDQAVRERAHATGSPIPKPDDPLT